MLLSGRVKPKQDGSPNRTDVNRICKEANFNPGLFERFSEFLVHAKIVTPARARDYQPGQHADPFGNRDLDGMREASRGAFLRFVGQCIGSEQFEPAQFRRALSVIWLFRKNTLIIQGEGKGL